MTDHPLTNEMIESISCFYLSKWGDTGEGIKQDMRAAADWQLKQVLDFIAADPMLGRHVKDYIYKAMRPQEES